MEDNSELIHQNNTITTQTSLQNVEKKSTQAQLSKDSEIEEDDDFVIARFNQRFNDLRRFDKYSDCSFKIENRIINCHKLILTACSPVFEAMFFGPLAESHLIRIDDIRQKTFNKMLDFIYTGQLDGASSVQELLELYYCAQKYLIEGLERMCIKLLYEITTKANVLKILRLSIEMSLEEIVYSVIYTIKHWMIEGETFVNYFHQKGHVQLSPKIVGLLVQEVFEFKDYNSILCFVRAWCLSECAVRHLEPNKRNIKHIIEECGLPKPVQDVFIYQNYANAKECDTKRLINRLYHKAARPLVIREENETKSSFWFDQFTVVSAFNINSRMMGPQQNIDLNETYDEEVILEIWANTDIIHSKEHVIYNADYNSSISIQLANPFIFFPGITYTVKFKWSNEHAEAEYPRSVLADVAKHKGIKITFSEDNEREILQGSILNGIVCDIENTY
uniref:CSON011664 protein n=1 Tax=Culicoides sonorensis TaxID=179676 RepID=A0A336M3Q3_CULSO